MPKGFEMPEKFSPEEEVPAARVGIDDGSEEEPAAEKGSGGRDARDIEDILSAEPGQSSFDADLTQSGLPTEIEPLDPDATQAPAARKPFDPDAIQSGLALEPDIKKDIAVADQLDQRPKTEVTLPTLVKRGAPGTGTIIERKTPGPGLTSVDQISPKGKTRAIPSEEGAIEPDGERLWEDTQPETKVDLKEYNFEEYVDNRLEMMRPEIEEKAFARLYDEYGFSRDDFDEEAGHFIFRGEIDFILGEKILQSKEVLYRQHLAKLKQDFPNIDEEQRLVDYLDKISDDEIRSLLSTKIKNFVHEEERESKQQISRNIAKMLRRVVPESVSDLFSDDVMLLEHIGEGGMGEVWRGRSNILDREVGIKIFGTKHADASLKERFDKEMKGMARINHPNVVKIFNGGLAQESNGGYFEMEYVEGQNVHDYFIAGGEHLHLAAKPEGPEELGLLDIGVQAAQGLLALHKAGVVHRDVKPANMLISGKVLKVMDFGLVGELTHPIKPIISEEDKADFDKIVPSGMTQIGEILGTPSYMSPEQIGGELDPKSDVWSLGVSLFYLATREMPFYGETQGALLLSITDDPIEKDLLKVLEDRDPGLKKVILLMLEKDPPNRPTMAQALQALQSLREKIKAKKSVKKKFELVDSLT